MLGSCRYIWPGAQALWCAEDAQFRQKVVHRGVRRARLMCVCEHSAPPGKASWCNLPGCQVGGELLSSSALTWTLWTWGNQNSVKAAILRVQICLFLDLGIGDVEGWNFLHCEDYSPVKNSPFYISGKTVPNVWPAVAGWWSVLPDISQVELNHAPPECSTVITLNSGCGAHIAPAGGGSEPLAVQVEAAWEAKVASKRGERLPERLSKCKDVKQKQSRRSVSFESS